MKTGAALLIRADHDQLKHQINFICKNPIIDSILKTVGGLLVILNESRQILALNESFIKITGKGTAEDILGLRPGEALGCVNYSGAPGGCGTGRHCATCGMAIAMSNCLENDMSEEKVCAATVQRKELTEDIFFKVNSTPVTIDNHRFILMLLQDYSDQQHWAAIENVFFHDIGNIINGLVGISNVLYFNEKFVDDELINHLKVLSTRLSKEIEMQKVLSRTIKGTYQPTLQEVSLDKILIEIKAIFTHHPSSVGKMLRLPTESAPKTIMVDLPLLLRVLTNMLTNAFEATDAGGEIKLWTEEEGDHITFCVWNQKTIPQDVTFRIFQRYFSTKEQSGRGFGTYSMKLFGEKFLNGRVDFVTSESAGTLFRLKIPAKITVKAEEKETIPPSYKILLVDDEPFNRELAKILLERSGNKVFPAANGLEALEILSHADIDAILMDDQMPVMDGTDAANFIRNCEKGIIPEAHSHKDLLDKLSQKIKGSHIPIFALTAHDRPGDRERYLQKRMDDYFTKPFEPKNILAKINRMKSSLG